VRGAEEQLRAETSGLKQRIERLEQENRRLSEANEAVKRDIGEASGMKGLLGNLEAKHEKLRETVARQGGELRETRRRNSEMGDRVQQLEKENCRLRETSEELKSQMARAEAGQQSAVTGLHEAIAAGESKVTENVTNLEQKLVKLKQEITRMKMTEKQFPPSVKKGGKFDVPDGIIAHLTRECGGNVHGSHVVDVTSGSFEKEIEGANSHWVAYDNRADPAARNAADLETDSCFFSAYHMKKNDIPHTRNNWICYDFMERMIVPTHYTIRTWSAGPGYSHLKSWLVETSADGENWREIAREEDNKQLDGKWLTAIFAVAGGGECRFIRLVNIGRNHFGNDCLQISAWEIFGSLFE
jgi:hypothetical protein